MSVAPNPSSTSSTEFDEGLALFVTFAILFILSVISTTSKFALWVGIALAALVWDAAYRSGQAKTFWQALAR